MKLKLNKKATIWLIAIAAVLVVCGTIAYNAEVPRVMAQPAVDSLADVVPAVSGQKVLIFSPHPDDETIAAGGYIAASTKQGADVRIVLVTDGNHQNNSSVRIAEFKKATGILGVPESNLVFMNLSDSKLNGMSQPALATLLMTQIDTFNPNILIFPDDRDTNPDHHAIGKAMEMVLTREPQQMICYEYLVHFKYFYPRPRSFNDKLYLTPPQTLLNENENWKRFPLNADIIKVKTEAINSYKSQLDNRWLHSLLLASIRQNELLDVPLKISP